MWVIVILTVQIQLVWIGYIDAVVVDVYNTVTIYVTITSVSFTILILISLVRIGRVSTVVVVVRHTISVNSNDR